MDPVTFPKLNIMKSLIKITTQWVLLSMVAVAQAQEAAPEPATPIFPDKNLEKAVRQQVFEKRYNEEPIVEADVLNISTIKGDGLGIRDLTGLEFCRSLASLELAHNDIEDLGPIRNLKRIQLLDVSDNRIANLEPLSGISALQYIELSTNQVATVKPLSGLTNLTSLYLSHNQIEAIDPLFQLPKLTSLYADNNRLTSISGIYRLKRLSTLSLRNNEIADLSPLFGLKELYYLFLENNRISDLGPLVYFIMEDCEGDRNFAPYLNLYLTGNPLQFDARREQLQSILKCGPKVVY